ncbi:hypothetical protein D3C76_1095860 [compost metagenome]
MFFTSSSARPCSTWVTAPDSTSAKRITGTRASNRTLVFRVKRIERSSAGRAQKAKRGYRYIGNPASSLSDPLVEKMKLAPGARADQSTMAAAQPKASSGRL